MSAYVAANVHTVNDRLVLHFADDLDTPVLITRELLRLIVDDYNARPPRVLAADDPEPAVGSVVLFDGIAYQRQSYGMKWWKGANNGTHMWSDFMRDDRPTFLIHDGGAE